MTQRDYTVGFKDGFYKAIEHIEDLHSKGYGRPLEVANILEDYWIHRLNNWGNEEKVPELVVASWKAVRNKVIARAKGTCEAEYCANPGEHVHHIESVRDGGLPEIDNLTFLCADCHTSMRGGRHRRAMLVWAKHIIRTEDECSSKPCPRCHSTGMSYTDSESEDPTSRLVVWSRNGAPFTVDSVPHEMAYRAPYFGCGYCPR